MLPRCMVFKIWEKSYRQQVGARMAEGRGVPKQGPSRCPQPGSGAGRGQPQPRGPSSVVVMRSHMEVRVRPGDGNRAQSQPGGCQARPCWGGWPPGNGGPGATGLVARLRCSHYGVQVRPWRSLSLRPEGRNGGPPQMPRAQPERQGVPWATESSRGGSVSLSTPKLISLQYCSEVLLRSCFYFSSVYTCQVCSLKRKTSSWW